MSANVAKSASHLLLALKPSPRQKNLLVCSSARLCPARACGCAGDRQTARGLAGSLFPADNVPYSVPVQLQLSLRSTLQRHFARQQAHAASRLLARPYSLARFSHHPINSALLPVRYPAAAQPTLRRPYSNRPRLTTISLACLPVHARAGSPCRRRRRLRDEPRAPAPRPAAAAAPRAPLPLATATYDAAPRALPRRTGTGGPPCAGGPSGRFEGAVQPPDGVRTQKRRRWSRPGVGGIF